MTSNQPTRVIKFRVWDNRSKSMLRDVTIDGHSYTSAFAGWNAVEMGEEIDGPVMQFTGLIDMNSKEVFEGDILRITNPYTKRSVIKSVWWNGETARFNGVPTSLVNVYEVIGNVYENGELL